MVTPITTEKLFGSKKSDTKSENFKSYVPKTTEELFGELTPPPGGIPQAGQTIDPALVPSKLRSLLPTKEQAPEFIGSMAGGLATGSKFNPAGAITSGLGAAGGELVRQGLEKTGVFETPAPQSFTESGKRVGEAFLRGTGSQLLGAGIGKIGSKLTAPFAESTVSAGEKALAEKVLGSELPPSFASKSPTVQYAERKAESHPFGYFITEMKNKTLKNFDNYAKNITSAFSQDLSDETKSNLLMKQLDGVENASWKAKTELYDSVIPLLKDRTPDLTNTINSMEEFLMRHGGEDAPMVRWVKSKLNEIRPPIKTVEQEFAKGGIPLLSKSPPPPPKTTLYSFDKLKQFATDIHNRGKWNNPEAKGYEDSLSLIWNGAKEDLDKTASTLGGEVQSALKEANAANVKYKELIQDNLFRSMKKTADSNPSELYKMVIKPNNEIALDQGKKLLGKNFNMVQEDWFNSILRKSESNIEGDIEVSPAKIEQRLREYMPKIDSIFENNPEVAQKIKDLYSVSKTLSRGKAVRGGSQTAFVKSTGMIPIIGGIIESITHPIETVGVAAMSTKFGRNMLQQGYPKVGNIAGQVIAKPSTQLGLQKYMEK